MCIFSSKWRNRFFLMSIKKCNSINCNSYLIEKKINKKFKKLIRKPENTYIYRKILSYNLLKSNITKYCNKLFNIFNICCTNSTFFLKKNRQIHFTNLNNHLFKQLRTQFLYSKLF